jgi:hypothetical protein
MTKHHIDWKVELATLHSSLPERLERLALMAEIANHHIGDMRVMPAAGVADLIYEALDEMREQRRGTKKKGKRSQTEIRVIELIETVEGLDHPHIEHRIQYRNGSGPWTSLPVVRVFDREEYQRMKDGADG